MPRLSLMQLDAVLAIARRGSFRAAALDLGLSSTALSALIARLEGEVGVRLFNRTTRSVSLTDAGRTFVDKVRPALDDIHEAMETVRSQQDIPSGTLRINAFATAARQILGPLLLAFLRRYPQVHIDLVTEGRIVDIVAEGFDLGLRRADLVPSDMIAIPVGPPQCHAVVASPAYFRAAERPRVPPDLLAHACVRVRLPNGMLYRWPFEKEGHAITMDVEGPITLDEASLARMAVLEGVGIGFFMEADVREDIAAGRLERVLADWTPPLAPISLYYPGRRNPSAAFRAFVDLAREFGRVRKADGGV
ncbi:MAG: LysR substrate-binding domain-containing protein [Phreatobacter sp.]|uniref:LysR substrate-binding domain-containing protein n=1 Tax=Phreatobacter sp. TaxID=1966341 RepID=UPI004035DA4E